MAYVGVRCLAKSDFDAIDNHRRDESFAAALGLSGVPAAPTLQGQLNGPEIV